MKKVYIAEGMKCGNCVIGVQDKLSQIEGIENVKANLEEKTVEIDSDEEFSLDILNNALRDTKYKLVEEK